MRGVSLRPELGENLLVVMDNCPACLEILRMLVSNLPRVNHRYFTLLHCCPTIYWEHGGDSNPETRREIDAVWKAEEDEYNLTQQYFDQASRVLQEAGVHVSHIRTAAPVEVDSLADATMAELRRGQYSGVIVSSDHQDIINRLHGRGLTDLFRRVPKVAVWAIDTEAYTST
jgi:hypothetical protein